jgi:hypothetical protein
VGLGRLQNHKKFDIFTVLIIIIVARGADSGTALFGTLLDTKRFTRAISKITALGLSHGEGNEHKFDFSGLLILVGICIQPSDNGGRIYGWMNFEPDTNKSARTNARGEAFWITASSGPVL